MTIVCKPSLIWGIFHSLLSHKDLLDGLHKDDKRMHYQIRKRQPSMGLLRLVEKLTKAKILFRDTKRSYCLIFFKAVISLGNKRGCSKASAR